ncbi:hypothetical protein LEMLEM_LOCUS4164 [Lemmus lemmus]
MDIIKMKISTIPSPFSPPETGNRICDRIGQKQGGLAWFCRTRGSIEPHGEEGSRHCHYLLVGTTMTKATMHVFVCVCDEHMHSFLLNVHLSVTAGSQGWHMLHCSKYCQTVFQIGCNNLLSSSRR